MTRRGNTIRHSLQSGGSRVGRLLCLPVLAGVLVSGCATPIAKYSLRGIQKPAASPYASYSLAVATLADARPQAVRGKRSWISPGAPIVKDETGRQLFFNGYGSREPRVTYEISKMLAKHLKASGAFRSVALVADDPYADLLLEGVLTKYEAQREARPSKKKAIYSRLGLLGVVASWGVRAKFTADVLIDPVRLKRRSTGEILWVGKMERSVEGAGPTDGKGKMVYQDVSRSLSVAVEQFIQELLHSGSRGRP